MAEESSTSRPAANSDNSDKTFSRPHADTASVTNTGTNASSTAPPVNNESPRRTDDDSTTEPTIPYEFYSLITDTLAAAADTSRDDVPTSPIGSNIIDESATGDFYSLNDPVDGTITAANDKDTPIPVSSALSNPAAGIQFTSTTPFVSSTAVDDGSHVGAGLTSSGSFNSILEESMNFDFNLPELPQMSSFLHQEQRQDDNLYASGAEDSFIEEEYEGVEEDQSMVEEDSESGFYEGQEEVEEDQEAVDEEGDYSSSPSTPRASRYNHADYEGVEDRLVLAGPRSYPTSLNMSPDQSGLPRSSTFGPRVQSGDSLPDQDQSPFSEHDREYGIPTHRQHQPYVEDYDDSSPSPGPIPPRSQVEEYDPYNSDSQFLGPNVTMRRRRENLFRLSGEDQARRSRVRPSSGEWFRETLDFVEAPAGVGTTQEDDDSNGAFENDDQLSFSELSPNRSTHGRMGSRNSFDEEQVTPRRLLPIPTRSRSALDLYGEDFETKQLDTSVTPTPPLRLPKREMSGLRSGNFTDEAIVPRPLTIRKSSQTAHGSPLYVQEGVRYKSSVAIMDGTETENSLSTLQQQTIKESESEDYTEAPRSTSRVPANGGFLPLAPENIPPIRIASRDPERTRSFPCQGEENFKVPAPPKAVQTIERPRNDPRLDKLEKDAKDLFRRSALPDGKELEKGVLGIIGELPPDEVLRAQHELDTASKADHDRRGFTKFWKNFYAKLKARVVKKKEDSATDHVYDAPAPSKNPVDTQDRGDLRLSNRMTRVLSSQADPSMAIPNFHLPSYEAGVFIGMSKATSEANLAGSPSGTSFRANSSVRGASSRPTTADSSSAAASVPPPASSQKSRAVSRPIWVNDTPTRVENKVEKLRPLERVPERAESSSRSQFEGQSSNFEHTDVRTSANGSSRVFPSGAMTSGQVGTNSWEVGNQTYDEFEEYDYDYDYDFEEDDVLESAAQETRLPHPPRGSSLNRPGVP